MKRVFILFVALLGISSATLAETTTFKQQILPIDCVYEVIDVGTQKLRYITPETCPIDPGPPIITEPPTVPIAPEAPNRSSTGSAIRWVYAPPVVAIPPSVSPESTVPETEQVQGAVVAIKDVIIQNRDSIILVLFAVTIWWLLLIVIKKYRHQR